MPKIIKIMFIVLASVVIVPVAIIISCISFAIIYTVGINLVAPSPDVTTIKEAEFPFQIVYEKNEEIFVIEDILICEYDGTYTHSGGKSRSWKEYFKSENDDVLTVFKDGTTEICIGIGSSRYYMNEPDYSDKNSEITPWASRVIRENGVHIEPVSEDELYSAYGIKIISWELSDPIENTYVSKKWYEFWK